MSPALRALLSGIIDYAGLFPPASLPLEPAIRNYARYRTEPEAWMLGRFICPAERLGELSSFVDELFCTDAPLLISALGRPTSAMASPERKMAALFYLAEVEIFQERLGTKAVVDMAERRCDAFLGPNRFPNEKDAKKKWFQTQIRHGYYEVDLTSDWRTGLVKNIDALGQALKMTREVNAKSGMAVSTEDQHYGFKLRCGGVTASAFPPPEQIAFALVACRDAGIPFKATAGLHHPIRQYRDEVKTKMHGFLNVFGAGVLAHACNLTERQVLVIIEDEDPKNFVFDDTSFRWKDYRANLEQITAARKMVTSFGSCSFDEPRDDLRALGLL